MMDADQPVQEGDLVRITANWGTYYWKRGEVVKVVRRVETFYECVTIAHKRKPKSQVLFRHEFQPLKYEQDAVATTPPEDPRTAAREAQSDAD